MISSGISDVEIASVYSEKTRLKKLIMIIIIIKNRKKRRFLAVARKLTEARKVMVDFNLMLYTIHREPPEVRNVIRKFVLVDGAVHANPT